MKLAVSRLLAASVCLSLLFGLQAISALTTAKANADERILIVGDSISQGSSGDYTWRYRLWAGLQSVRPTGATLVGTRTDLFDNVNSSPGSQFYAAAFPQKGHASQWGTTFANENPRVSSSVRATAATVAIVQLGTNDLSYSLTPAQAVAAADLMITNLRGANPNIKIVIGEVPHAYDPYKKVYRLVSEGEAYASGIRTLVGSRSTAASPIAIADTRTGWDAAQHTYDGVHPSTSGEGVIASAHLRALRTLGVIPSVPPVPTSLPWNYPGPAPSLQTSDETVKITWSRASSGASAMYIRYRFTHGAETSQWNELPYPVGGTYGDAWTMSPVAGGARYEVQLKPLKYLMAGAFGPGSTANVTGPTPGPATNVSTVGTTMGARVTWTAGSGATGHYIRTAHIYDSENGPVGWSELPYPALGNDWEVYGKDGHHLVVAIQSVRGFVRGAAAQAPPVRVPGIADQAVHVYIGDSYISGTGVPPYDDNCERSKLSWPNLVLQDWTRRAYMFACGGSTMDQMIAPNDSDKHTGQLELAKGVLSGNSTSARRVFMSIGGNDLKFSDKLSRCVTGNCAQFEGAWSQEISGLEPEMTSTFARVRRDLPYADIYLLGYPSIVTGGTFGPPQTNSNPFGDWACAGLRGGEGPVVFRLAQQVGDLQARVAPKFGIWTNPRTVIETFRNHEWCGTEKEWINYPTIDFGNWLSGQTAHPSGAGNYQQALIASNHVIARSGDGGP